MKLVPRTCTEIRERSDARQGGERTCSRDLKEFRTVPAYVLLGDPGAGKTTAEEALRRCSEARDFNPFELKRRLYGASLPADFGRWCLERALVVKNRDLAGRLLRHAVDAVFNRTHDEGLSLDILEERTRGTGLSDALPGLLADPLPSDYWERHDEARSYREEAERHRQALIDDIRANESALRENRCPLGCCIGLHSSIWEKADSGSVAIPSTTSGLFSATMNH